MWKKKKVTIIGRNCHNDVTGIRKCTGFVYTPRGAANRRSLLSLAGSTWQVDSVSRSLDPLPHLHRGVEGLDCRLSFLPTGNPLLNATWSRGENSNSWWKERGFLLLLLLLLFEGAIECVSRGIDSRLFRVQRRMWSCYSWYGTRGGSVWFWAFRILQSDGKVEWLVGESGSIDDHEKFGNFFFFFWFRKSGTNLKQVLYQWVSIWLMSTPRDFEKFGNFLILFCLEKVG